MLVLREFVGNIYLNSFSSSLFELFSAFLASFIIAKFDIKKSYIVTYIILSVTFLISAIFYFETSLGKLDFTFFKSLFNLLVPGGAPRPVQIDPARFSTSIRPTIIKKAGSSDPITVLVSR